MVETTTERRLLNIPTCAKALALSQRKVWSMLATGELRAVRIGRAVRVDSRDLDALIERLKTEVAL